MLLYPLNMETSSAKLPFFGSHCCFLKILVFNILLLLGAKYVGGLVTAQQT